MNWMGWIGLCVLGIGIVTMIGWVVIHRLDPSLSNYTEGLSSYVIRGFLSFIAGLVTIAGIPLWIMIFSIRAIWKVSTTPRTLG